MLLRVENLHTYLSTDDDVVRAVDGISFSVERGETFCLVGESGSGKSMTALSVIQLVPKAISQHFGNIWFEMTHSDGRREQLDVLALPDDKKRTIRGSAISMIFQEPMTSLNPVFTVGDQIVEALRLHFPTMTPREARQRSIEMLDQVQIPDPTVRIDSFPHQMSGGQRQRVMIAMALACKPDLLIADEPTTALDVTVQAEILRLIDDLQREKDMSVLFITHDLAVVSQVADHVAVMQLGKIVEQGEIGEVLRNPQHPYTKELLAAIPENLAQERREREGRPQIRGQWAQSQQQQQQQLQREIEHSQETTDSGRVVALTPSGRRRKAEAEISEVKIQLPAEQQQPEAQPAGEAAEIAEPPAGQPYVPRYVHTGEPPKELHEPGKQDFLLAQKQARNVAGTTALLATVLLVLHTAAMVLDVATPTLIGPGIVLALLGLVAAVGQWQAKDWARSFGRLAFSFGILRDIAAIGLFATGSLLGRNILSTPFFPFEHGGFAVPAALLLVGPLALNLLLLALNEHRSIQQLSLSENRVDSFARRRFQVPLPPRSANVVALSIIVGCIALLGLHGAQLLIAPQWIAPVAVIGVILASFGLFVGGQLLLGEDWVQPLGLFVFGISIPLVLLALVAVPFGVPLVSETSMGLNIFAGSVMVLLNLIFFGFMFGRTVKEIGEHTDRRGDYRSMGLIPGRGDNKSLAIEVEGFRFEKKRNAVYTVAIFWIAVAALTAFVMNSPVKNDWLGIEFGVPATTTMHMALFGLVLGLVSAGATLWKPTTAARRGMVLGVVIVLLGAGTELVGRPAELVATEVLLAGLLAVLGIISLQVGLGPRATLVTQFRGRSVAYTDSLLTRRHDDTRTEPFVEALEPNVEIFPAAGKKKGRRGRNGEEAPQTQQQPSGDKGNALLEVEGMRTYFPVKKGLFRSTVGYVKAVDGVDLKIPSGQILALVGESGCGKTTLGRSILRLVEPTGGRIHYDGLDIMHYPRGDVRPFRKEMQFIFQDPQSSLNPRLTIEHILTEPMQVHKVGESKEERLELARAALKRVELDPDYVFRYPHEFSGGQRQRIGIARALVLNPRFIVCDEVTSALDVSVQARILQLLLDLRDERNLTLLFITHNIGVVEYLSDETAVMYNGQIVERGPTDAVCGDPQHSYTKKLLAAVPRVQLDRQPRKRRTEAKELATT